jgi:glutamine amidotransferase
MQIAVIDLGMGNLRSVTQALASVTEGVDILLTSDAQQIESADKVVLPGQGAIGSWFTQLEQRGISTAVSNAIQSKPLLAICVGMQALFTYCEEDGGVEGLNVFDGEVRHFSHFHPPLVNQNEKMKIPHMGWNRVTQAQPHPLWQNIDDGAYFYFVHSYAANLRDGANTESVCGISDYGHKFVAAIARKNLFAVQFHPEKSHEDGLQLLSNFANWKGDL